VKRPALLALAALAACAPAQRGPRTAWSDGEAQVYLEYQGRALSVCALGDFNDWQPDRGRYEQRSPERWSLSLRLPPGRYAYLLRVEREDGLVLISDPGCGTEMRDGLGRRLSVLDLGASMGDIRDGP